MNLLLLLSALLSALTGVAGARGGAMPQAVCSRVTETPAPGAVATLVTTRPIQPLPVLAAVLVARGRTLALAPIEPHFASRRRE